jgi:hypothetical protein
MREVRVYGTVVENSLHGGNVDQAFKNSHGNAVMYERTAKGVKIVKAKRARGFPLKEIARFVQ